MNSSFNSGSDVEYTGLTDTALSYSGSTTLDESVDLGSALPLVQASGRNAQKPIGSPQDARTFTVSTYDLWDNENSSAALQLSGVSDPPFASAEWATPVPGAAPFSTSASNAFKGQSKFGSALATLLGNHPQMVTAIPSQVQQAGPILTHQAPSLSGHNTLIILTVVVVLGILLLRN